jgi:hypothetical protein
MLKIIKHAGTTGEMEDPTTTNQLEDQFRAHASV